MSLAKLCTRAVPMIITLAALAAPTEAAAQRTDYTYKRNLAPQGITTTDVVICDFAGNHVNTLRGEAILEDGKLITDAALNPTGTSILVLSIDKKKKSATVYETQQYNTTLHKFDNKKTDCTTPLAVGYTSDARQLLIAGSDSILRMYHPTTFKPIRTLTFDYAPTSFVLSDNGYYLATTDGHRVDVYNFETGKGRKAWDFESTVKDMAFSMDNDEFVILTSDGVANCYDTRNFLTKRAIDNLGEGLSCVYNFDGKYLAVLTSPTTIEVVNVLDPDDPRITIDVPEGGAKEIDFVTDTRYSTLLVYNSAADLRVKRMTQLAPYYGKLINEQVNEKMNEWLKMLPDETLEQYQARVNDETRQAQRRLFEAEIATSFADDLVNMATVSLGNYDRTNNVLAVDFDNMPTIFLEVPESDLGAFTKASDLEFKNAKYGVLPNDHFELIYAEVLNKADGKTYIFSNLDRVNLNYMNSDDNVVSLEIIQQQQMEEMRLQQLREKVIAEAKSSNVISDHTSITVDSRVVPDYDADGNRILNYLVNFTYQVEPEFSAVEDFGPGKYRIEESPAASAMLRIVKEAFEGDFAQYLRPGKKLLVKLSGTADASPILHGIPYDGVYGEYVKEPVYQDGQLADMTVTSGTGIKENEQLAFVRACAVKYFLNNNVKSIGEMNTDYTHHIAVSKDKGGEHRRITAEFTIVDAFPAE